MTHSQSIRAALPELQWCSSCSSNSFTSLAAVTAVAAVLMPSSPASRIRDSTAAASLEATASRAASQDNIVGCILEPKLGMRSRLGANVRLTRAESPQCPARPPVIQPTRHSQALSPRHF